MSDNIKNIIQKLTSNEDILISNKNTKSNTFIEIFRIIFGGWYAVGFLFILLYHTQINEILNMIPNKIKSSNEVSLLGISMKSTIKKEAIKVGAIKLSETIPSLSKESLELLFKINNDQNPIISYNPNRKNEYISISFPQNTTFNLISELQSKNLIILKNNFKNINSIDATIIIDKFIKQYKGTKQKAISSDNIRWLFNKPLSRNITLPYLTLKLTPLGKKAKNIIINSVAIEVIK